MRADLQKSFSIGDKIYKYEFVELENWKLTNHKIGKRSNVKVDDYSLTLDMAKELSMVENMICSIRMT